MMFRYKHAIISVNPNPAIWTDGTILRIT